MGQTVCKGRSAQMYWLGQASRGESTKAGMGASLWSRLISLLSSCPSIVNKSEGSH